MSDALHSIVRIDLLPLLAACLAAITCGLLGNFLLLRRLSLMGDAISHSVLPGLVIAFLISGMRSPLVMFVGAALAGVATVILVELVKRLGRVESGAAMGVVFSVLFALGVLLIEKAAARQVDLDADCVLHGQLETLFWFPPQEWGAFLSFSTLSLVPRQVYTLVIMALASIIFVAIFFKELRIAAFDPELATTQGFHSGILHYMLMIFVAAATVAAFEAVGSILVIAMLVCPAAIARMMTDRLLPQLLWSVGAAAACGILGYFSATALPSSIGYDAVNAAGMMAVVAGFLLVTAVVFSPSHGLVTKRNRQRALGRKIALDDLIAATYRFAETGPGGATMPQLQSILRPAVLHLGISSALRKGFIRREGENIQLTDSGLEAAVDIVRRHRQWESYLVNEADMPVDSVHDQAERFEHTQVEPQVTAQTDPHGRPIPTERKP